MAGGDWGSAMPGMLERMLETLGRSPERLDAVAALLADLKKAESGAELVDDEFEAAWSAIWRCKGGHKMNDKGESGPAQFVLEGLKPFQVRTASARIPQTIRGDRTAPGGSSLPMRRDWERRWSQPA